MFVVWRKHACRESSDKTVRLNFFLIGLRKARSVIPSDPATLRQQWTALQAVALESPKQFDLMLFIPARHQDQKLFGDAG
jgi:hypothetical protein